jgi:hypothetical protein
MGFPTSEVGYTSATTGRGAHEVHKGHVVALAKIVRIVNKNVYGAKIVRIINKNVDGACTDSTIGDNEIFFKYCCLKTTLLADCYSTGVLICVCVCVCDLETSTMRRPRP